VKKIAPYENSEDNRMFYPCNLCDAMQVLLFGYGKQVFCNTITIAAGNSSSAIAEFSASEIGYSPPSLY